MNKPTSEEIKKCLWKFVEYFEAIADGEYVNNRRSSPLRDYEQLMLDKARELLNSVSESPQPETAQLNDEIDLDTYDLVLANEIISDFFGNEFNYRLRNRIASDICKYGKAIESRSKQPETAQLNEDHVRLKADTLTKPILRSMISRGEAYDACLEMAKWVQMNIKDGE